MTRSLPLSITLLLLAFAAAAPPVAAQSKPTIAVADFEIKTKGAAHALGRGMSDMLVNALVEHGQFTVVERSRVDEILGEQGMNLGGMVAGGTGAQVGEMLGAQLLVLGTITEFEENAGGGAIGGFLKKKVGAVGLHTAHIGFTMRIIDATTGVVHASKSIDKKARSIGGIGGGSIFGVPMGGGFFKSKAMQNAVEEAINEAVWLLAAEVAGIPGLATATVSGGSSSSLDCSNLSGSDAPRIMVIIPEGGYGNDLPVGETEITRRFLENGLSLVDQQQVNAIRDQERVIHAFEDPALAAQLGVEFGAEIVVVGESTSEYAGSSNNMRSSRAHIEARVIESRTGRMIAANGTDGSGLDISREAAARKALRAAAEPLADYLLSQMCGRDFATGGGAVAQNVEIMLSGISFGDLQKVATALAGVPGVGSVQKSLTGGVGRLQVQFTGTTETLAGALTSMAEASLEIVGFADNKLEAKLVQ